MRCWFHVWHTKVKGKHMSAWTKTSTQVHSEGKRKKWGNEAISQDNPSSIAVCKTALIRWRISAFKQRDEQRTKTNCIKITKIKQRNHDHITMVYDVVIVCPMRQMNDAWKMCVTLDVCFLLHFKLIWWFCALNIVAIKRRHTETIMQWNDTNKQTLIPFASATATAAAPDTCKTQHCNYLLIIIYIFHIFHFNRFRFSVSLNVFTQRFVLHLFYFSLAIFRFSSNEKLFIHASHT